MNELQQADSWMQTRSGKKFAWFDLKPEMIDVDDIAHALAHICRFGGHTREFYSVAQHSVLMADLAAERHLSVAVQRVALLHDAAEAYIGDIVRPLKQRLMFYDSRTMTGVNLLEATIIRCIYDLHGLSVETVAHCWADYVKALDNQMCVTEARDLMGEPPEPWWHTLNVEPLAESIVPWESPKMARVAWLNRHRHLFPDFERSTS